MAPASLAGVRVLLLDGSDQREAFTALAGGFEFAGLPPGEWSVRLDPTSPPDGFAATQPELQVGTLAGSITEMEFELQAERREIRFTGGGELGH